MGGAIASAGATAGLWVLLLLGALLLVLLALLAVPVHVAFRVQGLEGMGAQVSIAWLFGLVRVRRRIPGLGETLDAADGPAAVASAVSPAHAAPGPDREDRAHRTDRATGADRSGRSHGGTCARRSRRGSRASPASRARRRRAAARAWRMTRDPAWRARAARLARAVLRAAHLRLLRLHLRVGLGDPADTGRLWALLGPLGAVLQARRAQAVRLEPDFGAAALAFDARGRAWLVPLHLAALVLGFVLSPTTWRAWHAAGASGG